MAAATHAGHQLRRLMNKGTVMLPGAFNGLVARMAANTGFQGVYVSGAALSASCGVPDVGLLGLDDFVRAISQIVEVSNLPVLADADTGFGGLSAISRAVFAYNRAGAAGLHIEDQVTSKRCGHLEGKQVVSVEEMEQKVRVAADVSRRCSDSAFLVCARTDARDVEGLDAAIERAVRYVAAGADMIFPEGLQSHDELQQFAEAMRRLCTRGAAPQGGPYLLANMTEFGKTPLTRLEKFRSLGYHCVIYPVTVMRVAMAAAENALRELKKKGTAEHLIDRMQTRQQLYETLKYNPERGWTYPSPTTHAARSSTVPQEKEEE